MPECTSNHLNEFVPFGFTLSCPWKMPYVGDCMGSVVTGSMSLLAEPN